MKPDRKQEAQRWLLQAESDLAVMRLALREAFYAHACFMAHEAAEKSLKALAYLRGDRMVMGHSISGLTSSLLDTYQELGPLRGRVSILDQYYIPTRYPDALSGGVPAEVYVESQAREALVLAEQVQSVARKLIEGA